MADGEPGTLNRWTALYKDVLKPDAERRRQVGDLRGGGTLLEFEQVADALEWSRLAHRAAAVTGIGDTPPRQPAIGTLPSTFTRRQPFRQPETGEAHLEGLRAAGLPD